MTNKKNIPLKTDDAINARVLFELISKEEDSAIKKLYIHDFITKCWNLGDEFYYPMAMDILETYINDQATKRLFELHKRKRSKSSNRDAVDIAIVTIIKEELDAAKEALDIDLNARETGTKSGLRFWKTSTTSTAGENINVVLTMVGKAGNVNCANECAIIFDNYKVDTCILSGIAAGLQGKVGLGDVVVADMIFDYERGRIEPDDFKKRFLAYPIDWEISQLISHFELEQEWITILNEKFQKHFKTQNEKNEGFNPKLHKGCVILAGEKLISDGSLPKMQQIYHDYVRAGEMEGSGFAAACHRRHVPWLVFRGISDFGDPATPDKEKWKPVAAFSAATAVVEFIKREYRKPQEVKF